MRIYKSRIGENYDTIFIGVKRGMYIRMVYNETLSGLN